MDFFNRYQECIYHCTEGKDLETLKWFMTFHGKSKSLWYVKLENISSASGRYVGLTQTELNRLDSGHTIQRINQQLPSITGPQTGSLSTVIKQNFMGQGLKIKQQFYENILSADFTTVHFQFMSLGFIKDLLAANVPIESNSNSPAGSALADDEYCGPEKNCIEFCLLGELIQDNLSNQIFLIQDLISMETINLNLMQKNLLIHEILEDIITTSLDPFLFQVKILYNYEPQMLDLFFKTILISYNVNMEGIIICNNYGWENVGNFRIVEAKNRVDLDLEQLDQFLENVSEIKIVNHIMDFQEKYEYSFSHNEKKVFYTKRDPNFQDIYLLFENPDNTSHSYYAMIPSLELSKKMNEKPDICYIEYLYHEFHQKWIPNI